VVTEEVRLLLESVRSAVHWQQDDPRAFLQAMASGGAFAIGAIDATLDDERLKIVDEVLLYHDRWVKEGGPHPDQRPLYHHPIHEFERKMRNEPIPQPELPEWSATWTKRLRGRVAALLDNVVGPRTTSAEDYDPPTAPMLQPRQLPAMVVVTLLENGNCMVKTELKQLDGVRSTDIDNISNLLTPGGDLKKRGLIDVDGRQVGLTPTGVAEARAQVHAGTTSLGRLKGVQDNSA
jgi:hypothetical protein